MNDFNTDKIWITLELYSGESKATTRTQRKDMKYNSTLINPNKSGKAMKF